jgi:hypothetical protein
MYGSASHSAKPLFGHRPDIKRRARVAIKSTTHASNAVAGLEFGRAIADRVHAHRKLPGMNGSAELMPPLIITGASSRSPRAPRSSPRRYSAPA